MRDQMDLKLVEAELARMMAETAKLNAETSKLTDERVKIMREHKWWPFLQATTAISAVIAAVLAIVKLLH